MPNSASAKAEKSQFHNMSQIFAPVRLGLAFLLNSIPEPEDEMDDLPDLIPDDGHEMDGDIVMNDLNNEDYTQLRGPFASDWMSVLRRYQGAALPN
jgi:hypothetical protein